MREPIACRLCGSDFVPRRGGRHSYCAPCKKKSDREATRVLRVKCIECGGAFSTPNRAVRYCSDPCRERSQVRRHRYVRRTLPAHDGTAKCRECGKKFATPSRVVRYCSDPCRKKGYARHHATTLLPLRPKVRTVKCRVCGAAFATNRGPGQPQVYCSAACRVEGGRAKKRNYMRRYLEDPEKRAIHAARLRASAAKRKAGKKGGA